jgi:hypothetical protein
MGEVVEPKQERKSPPVHTHIQKKSQTHSIHFKKKVVILKLHVDWDLLMLFEISGRQQRIGTFETRKRTVAF